MRDLPQDVAKVVNKMKVGEVSKAFEMIDAKGQQVCAIVKLKSRNDEHYASMTEDFQTLQEIVEQERQTKVIDEWIRDKQKNTYVRIKEDWRDCDFKYPNWINK